MAPSDPDRVYALIDSETKELTVAAQAGIQADEKDDTHRYDLPLKIGERTIGVFELVREAKAALGDDEVVELLSSAVPATGGSGPAR